MPSKPSKISRGLRPQAKDDLLKVETIFEPNQPEEIGYGGVDLIENDRGGKSKTFLGVGSWEVQNMI